MGGWSKSSTLRVRMLKWSPPRRASLPFLPPDSTIKTRYVLCDVMKGKMAINGQTYAINLILLVLFYLAIHSWLIGLWFFVSWPPLQQNYERHMIRNIYDYTTISSKIFLLTNSSRLTLPYMFVMQVDFKWNFHAFDFLWIIWNRSQGLWKITSSHTM